MQILATVQGDCNTLDRLMLGGIVIPLTLPDEDCNHWALLYIWRSGSRQKSVAKNMADFLS